MKWFADSVLNYDLNIVNTHGASVFLGNVSYLPGVTKYFMNVVTKILVLLSTVLILSLQKSVHLETV